MATNTFNLDWISGSSNIRQTQESRRTESTAIDARISVYPLGENHPLVSTFGVFENEPLWDDLMRAMTENRQELEALELREEAGE